MQLAFTKKKSLFFRVLGKVQARVLIVNVKFSGCKRYASIKYTNIYMVGQLGSSQIQLW